MGSLEIKVADAIGVKDRFGGEPQFLEFNKIKLLRMDAKGEEEVVLSHDMGGIKKVAVGGFVNIAIKVKG